MRLLVIFLWAVYAWTGAAAAAERDTLPSLDQLIRQFEATAFYATDRGEIIYKHRHPVEVYLTLEHGTDDEPYRLHLLRAAEEIGTEAETPIVFVANPERASLHALIGGKAFLEKRLTTFDRVFWGTTDDDDVRRYATARCGARHMITTFSINTEHPAAPDPACVWVMLYYSMGFRGDACHYRPSLLCPQDSLTELSAGDRLLLRALYDPRLRHGMAKSRALAIARRTLDELRRDELSGLKYRSARGETPTLGQAARQFESVVFLREDAEYREPPFVRKWAYPIRARIVSIPPEIGQDLWGEVARALFLLERETDWDIRFARDDEAANLDIVFTTRDRYAGWLIEHGTPISQAKAAAQEGPCRGVLDQNPIVGIRYASVLIAADQPKSELRWCILHELYNTMGPLNDACRFRPSIICEVDEVTELSFGDKLVLRLLYDYRVHRTAPPSMAMPVVTRLLPEYYKKLRGDPSVP